MWDPMSLAMYDYLVLTTRSIVIRANPRRRAKPRPFQQQS